MQFILKYYGMKTIDRYLGLLIMSILLSSCLTEQSIPIDQMEPGKVNLPERVRKVAFLSRNFKFDIDTLGQYYNYNSGLKKAADAENKDLDSIAVTGCFETLRKILLESGRFDEIAVYPYPDNKPHKGRNAVPLSKQYVKKLCKENNADAIVSLEMLSCFYSLNSGDPGFGIPRNADVKITAIWAVYLPGNDSPVDRFKYSDVINWNGTVEKGDQKKSNVPSRITAIKQACDIAATNYSKRLAPYWSKSERIIVGLNGSEWDKAISLAQKYKWDTAEKIWQSLMENKNSRVKGAAALDIAVAREMLGDYDQAAKWSKESLGFLPSGELKRLSLDYADLLKERKIETDKLNRLIK
jgi:hypothetical protein